jgi:chromosome segregation ATPase
VRSDDPEHLGSDYAEAVTELLPHFKGVSKNRVVLFQIYKQVLEKTGRQKNVYNQEIQIVEAKIKSITTNYGRVLSEIQKLETDILRLQSDISAKEINIRRLYDELTTKGTDNLKTELARMIEARDRLIRETSEANQQLLERIRELEARLKQYKLSQAELSEDLTRLNRDLRDFTGKREQLLRELNRLLSDCKAKFDLLHEFTKEFEVELLYGRKSRTWSSWATSRSTR